MSHSNSKESQQGNNQLQQLLPLNMDLSASEIVGEMVVDVKHQKESLTSKVVDLAKAPSWMRHDPLITRAYRKQQDSFRGCLESLWYIHNESVNIWSHLSAGLFFLAMTIWATFPALHGGYSFKEVDLRAVQTYLIGATICCMFSVGTPPFA